MTARPVFRRSGPPRPILVLVALSALLAFSLAAVGPGAASARAQEDPDRANAPTAPGGRVAPGASPGDAAGGLGGGGGGAGWDPLISTLTALVPIAGSIGLLIGIGIWGSAGPNSAQKAVGVGVIGTTGLGLVIGSFAADLAALFSQFI